MVLAGYSGRGTNAGTLVHVAVINPRRAHYVRGRNLLFGAEVPEGAEIMMSLPISIAVAARRGGTATTAR